MFPTHSDANQVYLVFSDYSRHIYMKIKLRYKLSRLKVTIAAIQ